MRLRFDPSCVAFGLPIGKLCLSMMHFALLIRFTHHSQHHQSIRSTKKCANRLQIRAPLLPTLDLQYYFKWVFREWFCKKRYPENHGNAISEFQTILVLNGIFWASFVLNGSQIENWKVTWWQVPFSKKTIVWFVYRAGSIVHKIIKKSRIKII